LAQNFFFLLGSKRHEISPSIGPRSSDIKARPPRTAARADVVGQFSSQQLPAPNRRSLPR
jgi:hypothetical protein